MVAWPVAPGRSELRRAFELSASPDGVIQPRVVVWHRAGPERLIAYLDFPNLVRQANSRIAANGEGIREPGSRLGEAGAVYVPFGHGLAGGTHRKILEDRFPSADPLAKTVSGVGDA